MARKSAIVTHNHPDGIKGAVTISTCIWMAERGKSKYPSSKYDFGCEDLQILYRYLDDYLFDVLIKYLNISVPKSIR